MVAGLTAAEAVWNQTKQSTFNSNTFKEQLAANPGSLDPLFDRQVSILCAHFLVGVQPRLPSLQVLCF